MALVVGIDLSTQSCTVEVRDVENFQVVARSRVPLPPTTPPVSEHDPLVWWSSLVEAFAQIRAEEVVLSEVRAISVSGQCHGLVALDHFGNPLRDAKLWNDTTTSGHAEKLVADLGLEEWVRRTGSVPTAAFTISKLAWLIDTEPETVSKTEQILLPHDYITYRLTGQYVTDRSEASGTGYFNSVLNEYDVELLGDLFGDVLDWNTVFPRVAEPEEQVGTVSSRVAVELGVPEGTPVAVGGGDQHVAALGLGVAPGDLVFSLGTSGVAFALSEGPVYDKTGDIDGVASVVGSWLPLACTLNCTKVTDWAAALLGVSVQELDRLALAAPNAEAVPAFAAFLDGERTPSYPHAAGVLAGLTAGTTREVFAASAFYGVLMGLLYGADALTNAGVPTDGRVIAVGGGSRSSAYTQFLADLLHRDVWVMAEPEATARGACVQALALLKGRDLLETGVELRPEAFLAASPRYEQPLWPELKEKYLQVVGFAAQTLRPEAS